MKLFRIIVTLSLAIVCIACASGVQKMGKIQPDMTPAEVNEIMGDRDGFKTVEKDGATFTLFQYTNQLCNGHVSVNEKCDFYVIFKNQRVIEIGTKYVRGAAPRMNFMYIFN
jgi:hypothetical protein